MSAPKISVACNVGQHAVCPQNWSELVVCRCGCHLPPSGPDPVRGSAGSGPDEEQDGL